MAAGATGAAAALASSPSKTAGPHIVAILWTGESGGLICVKPLAEETGTLNPTIQKEIAMYKHILVPTDGSKLSAKAIRTAARLARLSGAKLTGVCVTRPYVAPVYTEGMMTYGVTSARAYKELKEKEAKKALAVVDIEGQTSGVEVSKISLTADQPWRAIISTARSKKCDLIVMASHGRRGLSALLLGSETAKVLTHSKIPVLVCR